MKHKNTYRTRKLIFKRWTRTPWAVFASLKIVVHTRCTRISSFKDSLFKQQGADKTELASLFNEISAILEFEDIAIPWEELLLTEYLLPVKVTEEAPVMLLSYLSYIPVNQFGVDGDFLYPII